MVTTSVVEGRVRGTSVVGAVPAVSLRGAALASGEERMATMPTATTRTRAKAAIAPVAPKDHAPVVDAIAGIADVDVDTEVDAARARDLAC